MANPLLIQSQSKMIETRIHDLFYRIKRDYESGVIKSRTEYLYRLYHGLNTFYDYLGKPLMKVRPADGVPSRADYHATLYEIYEDIKTLYEESQLVSQALNESFHQTEVVRMSLDHQLKRIEDQMKDISVKLSRTKDETLFRDSFIDSSQFQQSMTKDKPAHVWGTEGVLTLQPRIAEAYTSEATVRIVGGNGLPGNTKQVRMINGELKFIGEESLHINLADILDSNADTWFEYEGFLVASHLLGETAHLGYAYEEGVSWVLDEKEVLSLTIEIEFPTARTMNWFSLNPFVPNAKGAAAAVITSIEIEDGKGAVYRPELSDELFNNEKIFMFGRQTAKVIRLTLVQPHAYDTEVGHLFYKEIEKQQVNYMDRMKYKVGKRIFGPMPSIENLGLHYDFEEKKIVYPVINAAHTFKNEAEIKTNLFMVPKDKDQENPLVAQKGFESLAASRFVIGIRDVGVNNYQFETTSEYVSTQYLSDKEIIAVSLVTEEDLPAEFPEGQWITYSISPDNGETWYKITPRGTAAENSKYLYKFNSNTPNEGRIEQFGYVDQVKPVTSLRLRIQLERPDSIQHAPYYTPIVRGYTLRVVTKGEGVQ